MADVRLNIQSGPSFSLRTKKGLSERLNLGNPYASGTKDYEQLTHKPQINGIELIGNKTTAELLIQDTEPLTNMEIEEIIQEVFFPEEVSEP